MNNAANDGETWKPIPGWPGYEASDAGRIRSTIHAPSVRKVGVKVANSGVYPGVSLYQASSPNPMLVKVHTLVAVTFIGPRPAGMEIDHLNGDKHDARPTNLEYVTRGENMRRAWGRGTYAKKEVSQ